MASPKAPPPAVPTSNTISLPSWLRRTVFAVVLLTALLWTPVVRPVFIVGLGYGKPAPSAISSFPDLACRRVHHRDLEACEDMFFSARSRRLFLACSDPEARQKWLPNMGRLDAGARSRRDRVVSLAVDDGGVGVGDGELDLKVLEVKGFGAGRELHLLGFTAVEDERDGGLDLFLVNNGPARDGGGAGQVVVDQVKAGGVNATIEQFRVEPGLEGEMKFVRTWRSEKIATPNNVAAVDLENIFLTNDHGYSKTGLAFELSPVVDTGTVVHCSLKNGCTEVASGFSFPNGLIHGHDGRLYVPSAVRGDVHVFSYDKKNLSAPLKKEEIINTGGYFVDNLSQDGDGTIWAASAPGSLGILKQLRAGPQYIPPSTVFSINRKGPAGWEVVKVAEDKHGEVLPGTTTVVHDPVKARLFMSGIMSPFLTICDRDATKAKIKGEK